MDGEGTRRRGSRRRAVLVAAALVVAAVSAGATAASTTHRTASKQPIVIGAAIAKTGFLQISDVPPWQGLQIAITDINKAGGVLGRPLKLVTSDTKTDRALGASAALATIKQGAVIGVVTCDLDFGAPAAVEFAKHKIVSFSLCAGAPTYGPKGVSPYAFSAGQATPSEAAGAATFAWINRHYKTAYVLKDTLLEYSLSWGTYFEKSFTKYGGKIVGRDTYNNNDASVQTQVARLRSANPKPDVIVMCGVQPGGPSAIRQIRAAGVNTPLILCDGLDGANWLPSVPGLKDAFVVSYGDWNGKDPDAKIRAFFKKFIARFGQPNNGHALQGYGLAQILAEGVKRAKTTDGPTLKNALETFRDFKAISGCTTYTKAWHNSFCRPTAFKQIENGKAVFAARVTPKPGIVVYPK